MNTKQFCDFLKTDEHTATLDHIISTIIARGKRLEKREQAVLKYCNGHTQEMWAATIVGILLECDFRDATQKLQEYLSMMNDGGSEES